MYISVQIKTGIPYQYGTKLSGIVVIFLIILYHGQVPLVLKKFVGLCMWYVWFAIVTIILIVDHELILNSKQSVIFKLNSQDMKYPF